MGHHLLVLFVLLAITLLLVSLQPVE